MEHHHQGVFTFLDLLVLDLSTSDLVRLRLLILLQVTGVLGLLPLCLVEIALWDKPHSVISDLSQLKIFRISHPHPLG